MNTNLKGLPFSVCRPRPEVGKTEDKMVSACASASTVAHSNNRELRSNPSFKPSPNSVARRPASAGPAAHFALAVRRATLSGPA